MRVSKLIQLWLVFATVFFLAACGGGGGGGSGNSGQPPVSGTPDPNYKFSLTAHEFGGSLPLAYADGTKAMLLFENVPNGISVYVSNYDNTSATWSTPTFVYSQVEPVERFTYELSIDGVLRMAWVQRTNNLTLNDREIYAATYTKLGGWESPKLITTFTSDSGSELRITSQGIDKAVLVWTQRQDLNFGYFQLWSSTFDTMSGWTMPLVHDNTNGANQLQLGSDSAGLATLIWSQGGVINYSQYDTSWSTANLISDRGDYLASAFSQNGDIIMAWYQVNPTGHLQTYSSQYSRTGGWSKPASLMNDTDDIYVTYRAPGVAINASGSAVVGWNQAGANFSSSLYASTYTPTDGWTVSHLVGQDIFFDLLTSIYVLSNGDIKWFARMGNTDVVSYLYSPSKGWGPISPIFSSKTGVVFYPGAAINNMDVGVLSWNEIINSTTYVYARIVQ